MVKKTITGALTSGVVFVLFLLMACQGMQTTVAPERRIALHQGGPHDGSWESQDVFIQYQYVKQPGTFTLKYGGHAKHAYDQVSVWVLFLDSQGKTLDTKSIFNSGFRQNLGRDKRSFEKTFEIPAGTTQFAFQSMLKARIGL
ncbi:MAG: hypothetical protein V3V39_03845 [Desulfobacterales bacterium]